MFRRRVFTWFLLGCAAWLLFGCKTSGHDSAHIPPPYTADFHSRKEDDRLAFLSDCIRRRIDLPGSYYKRARLYLEKGDYTQALRDVDQAIAAKANVGEYYLLRGMINRELNHLDVAFQDAERAEALQQKSPKLYILMADILQENKKYKEAERYINGILPLAPYDASVYYVQGLLQAKTGDTLSGLQAMEQAVELNPKFYRAYPRLASFYTSVNDWSNARRILTTGLRFFPTNTDLLLETARLYAGLTQTDSALIYYVQAANLQRDNLEIQEEMASVYIKSRNFSAALKTYEEIQKKKPDYPAIHYHLGFCYEKMWRLHTARTYYEQELELNPGYVPARNGLWRITQLEQERLRGEENQLESSPEPARTLDGNRLDLTPIQPRRLPGN